MNKVYKVKISPEKLSLCGELTSKSISWFAFKDDNSYFIVFEASRSMDLYFVKFNSGLLISNFEEISLKTKRSTIKTIYKKYNKTKRASWLTRKSNWKTLAPKGMSFKDFRITGAAIGGGAGIIAAGYFNLKTK